MLKKIHRFTFIALVFLIQTACTSISIQSGKNLPTIPLSKPPQSSLPKIDQPVTEKPLLPESQSSATSTKPTFSKSRIPSPAVLALLSEAEINFKSGQLENAASTLERAIRLQPRNPLL